MIVVLIIMFVGIIVLCYIASSGNQKPKLNTMIKLNYYLGTVFLFRADSDFIPVAGTSINTPEQVYRVRSITVIYSDELPVVGDERRNTSEVRVYLEQP